jgi:multicomponent K+:H+ antiporter subunit C
MEFLLATGIGFVTACGIWLMLRGRTFPVVLGLSLLGYAVNVFIFAMGRLWSNAPAHPGRDGPVADPLAAGAGAHRHRDRLRHHRLRDRAGAAQPP